MGAAETRRAIEAAAARAAGLARAAGARSARAILRRWADLMIDHQEDLARAADHRAGQAARRVARRDRLRGVASSSGSARRPSASTATRSRRYMRDRRIVVTKEPVGVTRRHHAVELPGRDVTRKAAPALAAGCTMVLKPAEQTPLSALAVARARRGGRAARRACFSVVTGDAEDAPVIGGEMTSQPDRAQARLHRLDRGRQAADGAVRRAGQEDLARARRQRAVHRLRRRRPRRGGRRRAASASSATPGQTCISANRILVQDGVYDDVRRRASPRRVAALDGRPTASSRGVNVGPLIDAAGAREGRAPRRRRARARRRAARSAASARARRAVLRSRPCSPASPTTMAMSSEETFGPVAGIAASRPRRRRSRIANDTPYGLAGVLLQPRHRPRLARRRGARVRDRRHQHRASSRPRSRRSAASRSRASAARARSTGSTSGSSSSTWAWAAS